MKLKILFIFNLVILITMPIVIIYQINFAEETDMRLVGKAVSLFIIYALAMLGIKRKRSPFDYKVYEEQYKSIIREAFKEDRSNYMRLMRAIRLFNENKHRAAVELLEKLKKECVSYQDTSAVLMFQALCYSDKKETDKAIEAYKELLKVDVANSRAWSNLGLLYQDNGYSDLALEAYEKAVYYDDKNAHAHTNIAFYYLEKVNPHKVIEHSLRALEVDKNMKHAMVTAMYGYALLGDKENAEKYYKMYSKVGKDAKKIKQALDKILAATIEE